jgi:hypothetical protein
MLPEYWLLYKEDIRRLLPPETLFAPVDDYLKAAAAVISNPSSSFSHIDTKGSSSTVATSTERTAFRVGPDTPAETRFESTARASASGATAVGGPRVLSTTSSLASASAGSSEHAPSSQPNGVHIGIFCALAILLSGVLIAFVGARALKSRKAIAASLDEPSDDFGKRKRDDNAAVADPGRSEKFSMPHTIK